jgi:hypothetical protein
MFSREGERKELAMKRMCHRIPFMTVIGKDRAPLTRCPPRMFSSEGKVKNTPVMWEGTGLPHTFFMGRLNILFFSTVSTTGQEKGNE